MRIGIIANTTKYDVTNYLLEFIRGSQKFSDLKIILSKNTHDFIKTILKKNKLDKLVSSTPENKFKNKIDLLLSFGGDGTMLYSAQFAIRADVVLAGVNFGKLGFLADINYHDLIDTIKKFRNSEVEIEKRILLEAKISNKKSEKLIAINDIVIEKGSWSRIIEINTWVDNKFLTTYRSDGLIISTPTGSTGYSLSSGGPILLPEMNSITLSPICPHTLTVRPIVIPAESTIRIEAFSGYETITINKDGQQSYKIKPPVKLTIKKYSGYLKLLKRKDKDFFQTLREKLMWGVDIREKNKQ